MAEPSSGPTGAKFLVASLSGGQDRISSERYAAVGFCSGRGMAGNTPRRMCIFCSERPVGSKEHFYPQWMASLLPPQTIPTYHTGSRQIVSHVPQPAVGKVKAGHIATKKFREVCRECNSGWMNRAETAARPLLEKMMRGDFVKLSEAEQVALAQWISIKTIVAEQADRPHAVTPQSNRTQLMQSGLIPSYFRIYVFLHSSEAQTGFHRFATELALLDPSSPSPPVRVGRKNTQQVTFAIGKLLVHVTASLMLDFSVEAAIRSPHLVSRNRLWPRSGYFEWPNGPELDDVGIAELADSFERVVHPYLMG